MAANIIVSAARLLAEYESESQNVFVSAARLLAEYDLIQEIRVSAARILVEYTIDETPPTPDPPVTTPTTKKDVQLRWLGMQM